DLRAAYRERQGKKRQECEPQALATLAEHGWLLQEAGELGHFHCFVGIEAPAPQVSEILWLSSRFEKQAGSRYHGPDGDSALVYFSPAAVCAGPRWRWGTDAWRLLRHRGRRCANRPRCADGRVPDHQQHPLLHRFQRL